MRKEHQGIKSKSIFITGIDTGIGKTIASAIIKEALKADYWKPVQCGDLDQSDTLKVKSLSSPQGQFFKERFSLKNPLSPHQAAAKEGLSINLSDFALPETKNWLVVEGAGGVLVPLNDKNTILYVAFVGISCVSTCSSFSEVRISTFSCCTAVYMGAVVSCSMEG